MNSSIYGLKKLSLLNFRNYKNAQFSFNNSVTVIQGSNGVGKTTILEAVSLLSFNKGLRGANLDEVIQRGENCAFIEAQVQNNLGNPKISAEINYCLERSALKKRLYLEDSIIKSQKELEPYLDCLWLTPQMDNFFIQDNKSKRKFIDKMVVIIDKKHNKNLNEYDKLIRERNKILLNVNNDKWLDIIEEKISSLIVLITLAREEFIVRLNTILKESNKNIVVSFTGIIEDLFLEHKYALTVENIIKQKLCESRKKDSLIGITTIGSHRSYFECENLDTKQNAKRCSTGEQKLLLINIMLAFIKIIDNNEYEYGNLVLLLDEIIVHLDSKNATFIIEQFLDFRHQLLITTTSKNIFSNFNNRISFLELN